MSNTYWKDKRVLVTGGAGFIGSYLVEKLVAFNSQVTVFDNLQSGTLDNIAKVKDKVKFIKEDCTNIKQAEAACNDIDIVMNLAARVGGIEFNRTHQATMMRDNLLPASVMIEAAHRASIKRFLVVSSACVYPHDCSVPTPESEGFLDEPEPTNGGYGWAKRMAELSGRYYAQEFGMKVSIVRPYNCYGPRDHFEPENSHVIPALIKRVFDRENPISVWGSGNQTRAFLYVEDLVEGMMLAVEKYPNADPVNLGTDEEVSIKALIEMIVRISGFNTKIKFDTSKPDGSPRRNSDNTKAQQKLGFKAKTKLEEGLQNTIDWYRQNKKINNS